MYSNTKPMAAWIPHQYQEWGVEKMVSNGAAGLLLDPGLGKTSISLAAIMILLKMGYIKRVLIIAPLRVCRLTWPNEIDKWSNFCHLVYDILHGPTKDWSVENAEGTDIFLINPEGLQWLVGKDAKSFSANKLKKLGVDCLIVDESTKFKHSTTVRFKLLRKMLPFFKRRYILTGTFSPNGAMDMFGQVFILDGGRALGQYITHFRKEFFDQPDPVYEPYRYELKEGALEKMTERIAPLVMRLKAEDYIDMPELIPKSIKVQIPESVRDIYNELDSEYIYEMEEGTIMAANAAVVGNKLRQICNGAVYDVDRNVAIMHDAKLEALESLLDELQGQPILLLYEYEHDRDRILKKFPQLTYIGSGVGEKREAEILRQWNNGELPGLIAHPKSIGHGLNMQEGTCYRVGWFGPPWDFELFDQCTRRIWRQGQKSPHVFCYFFVAEGTKDEDVAQVLSSKEATQEKINQMLTRKYN